MLGRRIFQVLSAVLFLMYSYLQWNNNTPRDYEDKNQCFGSDKGG
jgi:hypothetical protein